MLPTGPTPNPIPQPKTRPGELAGQGTERPEQSEVDQKTGSLALDKINEANQNNPPVQNQNRLREDFSKLLDTGNMFALLKQAKEENSPGKIKTCLDFIALNIGIEIDVQEDNSISLRIEEYHNKLNSFSSKISILSNIMEGKIAIDFFPKSSIPDGDISKFLELYGKQVRSLELKEQELERDIDLDKILQYCSFCPNLQHLTIDTYSTFTNLDFRGLKKLTSVNLSYCSGLKKVPLLPDGLKSLNLFGCSHLKEASLLPDSIEHLNISGCLELRAINLPQNLRIFNASHTRLHPRPDFPNGVEKLHLSHSGYDLNLEHTKIPVSVSEIDLADSTIKLLPKLPDGVRILNLNDCVELKKIEGFPEHVETLFLNDCNRLGEIPDIPQSVTSLELSTYSLTELKPPTNLLHFKLECMNLSKESQEAAVPGMMNALEYAVKSNSEKEANDCVAFLNKQRMGFYIEITRSSPLSITFTINSLNDKELGYLNHLSEISSADNIKFFVNFKSASHEDIVNLEKLIETHGTAITSLKLNLNINFKNQLLKKIIDHCPNIRLLKINAKTIDAANLDFSGLKKLASLQLTSEELKPFAKLPINLKSLNIGGWLSTPLPPLPESLRTLELFGFLNMQELVPLPDRLKKLTLYHCHVLQIKLPLPSQLLYLELDNCNALEALPELPDSLETLIVDDCENLKQLTPKWPVDLIEFKLKKCHHVSNSVRLSALSSIFDMDIDQGIRFSSEFYLDNDTLFELFVEKFIRNTNLKGKDYKAVFINALENKVLSTLLMDFTLLNFIKYNEFFSPEQKIQIAKSFAKQFGDHTADNIHMFDIQDPSELFEIAKLCAKQNGNYVLDQIDNFNMNDDQFLEVLKIGLLNCPLEIRVFKNIIHAFGLKKSTIYKIYKELSHNDASDELVNKALDVLQSYAESNFSVNPFENAIKTILNISDAYTKLKNFLWLASALIMFNELQLSKELNNDQLEQLKNNNIIDAIADIGKPYLRYALSQCVLSSVQADLTGPQDLSNKLIKQLFATLVSQGVNPALFEKREGSFRSIMEKVSSVTFKEELIEMLSLLIQDTALSSHEKENLLMRIVKEDVPKIQKSASPKPAENALLRNIESASFLIKYGQTEKITTSAQSLSQSAEDILKVKFCCEGMEDFGTKFAVFRGGRNFGAILTYASKIQSLSDSAANACFGRFIISMLNNTFEMELYNIERNPHLKTMYDHDGGKFLESWKTKLKPVSMKDFEEKTSNIKLPAREWLDEKFGNEMKALNLEELTKYLEEPDQAKSKTIKANLDKNVRALFKSRNNAIRTENNINDIKKSAKLIQEMEETEEDATKIELANFRSNLKYLTRKYPALNDIHTQNNTPQEIVEAIESRITKDSLKEAKVSYNQFKLQQLCIQMIDVDEKLEGFTPGFNEEIYQIQFGNLQYILSEMKEMIINPPFNSPPFLEDIESKLNEKNQIMTKQIVVDTDNPILRFRFGTDVHDSCQSIYDSPHLNKGVLGALEGHIGHLDILSEDGPDGVILARCIIKVPFNENGTKPLALLMEPIYPHNAPPIRIKALVTQALLKAESLGLPLVSPCSTGDEFGETLHMFGGSAPYEYSDSADGIQEDGIYEITDAKYIRKVSDYDRKAI